MGKLSNAAARKVRLRPRKTELPPWFNMAGAVVAAFAVLGVGWNLVAGNGTQTTPDRPSVYVPSGADSATSTVPADSPSPGSVELPAAAGETVTVPAAAAAVAKLGVTAFLGGDWSTTPTSSQFRAPTSPSLTTPSVGNPDQGREQGSGYVVAFPVKSPSGNLRVAVTVVPDGDIWVVDSVTT